MHGDLTAGADYAFNAAGGVDTVAIMSDGHEVTFGEHFVDLENIDLTGSGENSLRLTHQTIQGNHSPFTLLHDNDDTVDYGEGWQIAQPQIVEGMFTHRLSQGEGLLHVRNARPFQNPLWRIDVNASGQVAPNDVLVVINKLNRDGGGQLDPPSNLPDRHFYMDVNGDNVLSPIDALIIINFINSQADAEAEADLGWPIIWQDVYRDHLEYLRTEDHDDLSIDTDGEITALFQVFRSEEGPSVSRHWPSPESDHSGISELLDLEDSEWLTLLEDLAARRSLASALLRLTWFSCQVIA
jgi:hypothetical protein